jgi:hypothetical protein
VRERVTQGALPAEYSGHTEYRIPPKETHKRKDVKDNGVLKRHVKLSVL